MKINKKYMDAHKELHMNEFDLFLFNFRKEKKLWEDRHPDATPDEYLRAIRAIQKKLGVKKFSPSGI